MGIADDWQSDLDARQAQESAAEEARLAQQRERVAERAAKIPEFVEALREAGVPALPVRRMEWVPIRRSHKGEREQRVFEQSGTGWLVTTWVGDYGENAYPVVLTTDGQVYATHPGGALSYWGRRLVTEGRSATVAVGYSSTEDAGESISRGVRELWEHWTKHGVLPY